MKKYDYLIVGSGLYAATFAYEMTKRGKKCLIVERRNHVGGNVYCENILDINVHKYGAHIFHTSDKMIWDYVNQFCEFNNYINSPIACYKNEVYNLPFNMNTFSKLWNITTPDEAKKIINEQRNALEGVEPSNLEEQAISLVGKDIYEKLIKEYTEKQWNRSCCELPAFIIKRLPVRFTYNNNYFNDRYQGIPIGGYNVIIEKLLENIEVKVGKKLMRKDCMLSEIEKELDKNLFYQIDRKYIVNMLFIERYNKGMITIGGEQFQVSRRRKKMFEKAYWEFDILYGGE